MQQRAAQSGIGVLYIHREKINNNKNPHTSLQKPNQMDKKNSKCKHKTFILLKNSMKKSS